MTLNKELIKINFRLPHVKEKIKKELEQQAEANLGMSMTFTLFEWVKEAKEELLQEQPELSTANSIADDSLSTEIKNLSVNDENVSFNYHCIRIVTD